jgi:hypothetical protein
MPVTCASCNKEFGSIGLFADHISDTNKGQQGDLFAGFQEQMEEMMKDNEEMQHHLDAMRGFAHVRFRDKNGVLLPEHEVVRLHVLTTAGAKRCGECQMNFANIFRLAEHYLSTGHEKDSSGKDAKDDMKEFQEFERRYF